MTLRSITLAAIGCGLLGGWPSALQSADLLLPDADLLLTQRAAFRDAYADAELGIWHKEQESLLGNYVLWPDLKAAYLRTRTGKVADEEIRDFLERHGTLKPARELRYRFALHLAGVGRLDEYFEIYQQYYQGLELAKLDCLALQAELAAGRDKRVINRARALWLVGHSQDSECDPVFDTLRTKNLISKEHYEKRFALAIEARQFSLAKYLSRTLGGAYAGQASDWLRSRNDPQAFLQAAEDVPDSETGRAQLAYALQQIAYDEPLIAQGLWQNVESEFSFSPQQQCDISRHIALWAAREHLPEAHDMLLALPEAAVDTEAGRWLVRTSLLRHDWQSAIDSVDALPPDEHAKPVWQFWRSVAVREAGQTADTDVVLQELALDRSYYGFLAADVVNTTYAFGHTPTVSDEAVLTRLASAPAIVRARELFLVGLDGRGRSEWDAATRDLDRDEKMQAAMLAHRLGWHSRAIATMANAASFDDLNVRYPLPWLREFEQHSKSADIPHSWAYGIARSESLFMRDIRSSAGAIGLMQLMPATGKETANEINLAYGGRATLTDSSSNIRLGTAYLSKMFNRFDDNQVLATAAYNAGPHRVEKWLQDKNHLDARIWIENIPYRETREYVRRVLTDETIFYWRITGKQNRVTSRLPIIDASSDLQRVASIN